LGGVVISACLFLTETPAKSESLVLAAPDPVNKLALRPRTFWQQQFHRTATTAKQKARGSSKSEKNGGAKAEEGEEDLGRQRAIKGLGDEAYWMGNATTGALYVLKGEVFLRISVGGMRQEKARMETSKTLALAALKRL
jgi:hypothetical protein